MFVGLHIEPALAVRRRRAELQQVERGQIARRIVEEHVFRTRVRRDDGPRDRAGMPVVDRRVELDAGIGRGPGGITDLLPQLLRLQRLVRLAVEPARQLPIRIGFHRAQKLVGDADGIVGILAGDREIGLRIPVQVERRETRSRDSPVSRTG